MAELDEQQSTRDITLPQQRTASDPPAQQVAVPAQAQTDIPTRLEWKTHGTGNAVRLGIFLGTIVLVGLGIAFVAIFQTPASGILLGVAAVLFVVARATLSGDRPREAVLKGSLLTLTHDGVTSSFNLAEPLQPVRMSGTPGSRSWKLEMTEPSGDLVTIKGDLVDSVEMARIVTYYRGIAKHIADQRGYQHGRDCQ